MPVTAILFSLWQQPLFQGSAEVYLSNRNLGADLTGTTDPARYQQAERLAQTQAEVARALEIAERTLAEVGLTDRTVQDFLDSSRVTAKADADILVFQVTDPARGLAVPLANEYARQFTIYREELDTVPLERARMEVAARIAQLKAAGNRDSALYASLVDKEQQLRTMEALQTSSAFVVRPANEPEKVQPRPVRNAILALALGIVLGVGLAFLWEALDTRVRSSEEIAESLGLPLLARLPEPPRHLRDEYRLVMGDPTGFHAEPFRTLRTNLEFVNHEHGARLIMFTSALQAEGKSTTVANLALALARAGRRVVLVDLDLRRPMIDRFFELEGRPGLTNVVVGHSTLEDALAPLAVTERTDGRVARPELEAPDALENGNGRGLANVEGTLEVLPAGPVPPNPGEFITGKTLETILGDLRERADFVLLDAPPLLQVGDALTLSGKVDALVLVTRLKLIRRATLTELRRVLDGCPTRTLGFVETGAEFDEGYGYGYGAYSHRDYSRVKEEELV